MTISSYSDLSDAVVFITGGGSGLGADFVRALSRQGAKVAFVSITPEPALAVCTEVEQETGLKPLYIQCDIKDIAALKAAINTTEEKLGSVDILVNNAARDTRHTIEDFSVEQWDDSLNTNLRPHFFTAQAVVPGMKAKGAGCIINVGSNSANLGLSGYSSYVAAKAGIVGLTKAMARELGPDNIRVNALIPGWVMTERQKRLWATPEAVEQCLSEQCLKTTISEDDVSNSLLFLASKASAMITGQSLIVDAGRV